MIVNNGMKGALIRNAGLPGQYLEDLPPDDGSQRLYNLRDYSARFGGATNLAESSILLSDGRMVSMYEHLKSKGIPIYGTGSGYISVTFDDTNETILLNRGGGSNGSALNACAQIPLPEGMQSLSATIQCSRLDASALYYVRSLFRLMRGTIPVSTFDYNYDDFDGLEVRGGYSGAPGAFFAVVNPTPPYYPGKLILDVGADQFCFRVDYTAHNGLCKLTINGVVYELGHIDPPNLLFLGLGGVGYSSGLCFTKILPNL